MPHANEQLCEEPKLAPRFIAHQPRALRSIVTVLGVLLAVGGIDHGFFEVLQGNAPTPGHFVHAIGPVQQMWLYGTEDAFTLLPSFLASGITSIALSLLLAAWAIAGVHRKYGSTVFLVLSVSLFLSGGGVAQVLYFALAWAISLRTGRPPRWPVFWIQPRRRAGFGRVWPAFLAAFVTFSALALQIAITGVVPGVHDPLLVLHTCWLLLAAGFALLLLAIAAACAADANCT